MDAHGCIGVPCRICFPHLQPFTKDEVAKAEQAVLAEVDSLRAQLAAVTAQRDELLRAAVKVLNTSPRTSSSNPRELDHMDACTDLGVAVERIARAHPEQPPQPKEEP